MNKKYTVRLTPEEKQELQHLINQGKAAARKLTHARILLKANCTQEQGGWTDQAIHQAIDVSLSTIARVRQIFVEQGLDAALNSKPWSQLRLRKLDGVAEARLIACCCSHVVQDNLNTHVKSAVYEAFPPEEAKRLLDKLEFHYTPKHGSWLNIAEIELSVVSGQCLDQRIPDPESLKSAVAAWEAGRNAKATKVNWRFTTNDARLKLKRLYPYIEEQWLGFFCLTVHPDPF